MSDWDKIERRHIRELSQSELDDLAELAAKKALEKVYVEVGRSVLKKLAWLVGVVTVGLMLWLTGKGVIVFK